MSPNEKPRERRALELENECADRVAGKGYRVHQNPTWQEIADARLETGDSGRPEKAPDFLIEGHVFDCYAPTAPVPPRAVWSAVSRKVDAEQTQRVMLNLHDWRGDLAALHKQFHDWPITGLKELAAVTRDGAIIQIIRRD
ncbi:hypothetical protein ACFY1S_00900 [Micromonospora sp. NPDC000663]|uniref:CdiA C-terminal domain-containing protein n=1 Tax=Micromonospora sp. NPDC000663 TaxID=3364218 RepID=UPI003688B4BF